MSVQMKSAIKLEDAFFCLSCELVTNSSDLCPACGHRHLWPLENWIGRVDACENSRYKCILEKALPERAAEISQNAIQEKLLATGAELRPEIAGVHYRLRESAG